MRLFNNGYPCSFVVNVVVDFIHWMKTCSICFYRLIVAFSRKIFKVSNECDTLVIVVNDEMIPKRNNRRTEIVFSYFVVATDCEVVHNVHVQEKKNSLIQSKTTKLKLNLT